MSTVEKTSVVDDVLARAAEFDPQLAAADAVHAARRSLDRLSGFWEPQRARGTLVRLGAYTAHLIRCARCLDSASEEGPLTEYELTRALAYAQRAIGKGRPVPNTPGAVVTDARKQLDSIEALLAYAEDDGVRVGFAIEQRAQAILAYAIYAAHELERQYAL